MSFVAKSVRGHGDPRRSAARAWPGWPSSRGSSARLASGRAKITELRLAGRGIPRDERASYQAVVEELWAAEPPQVTEQALRMPADGLSCDAVLDKLARDR